MPTLAAQRNEESSEVVKWVSDPFEVESWKQSKYR